ncbi:Metallo-dependent phosphatase-like protein [Roridomyces roridus]|uniref:Metallo-dependent phosphatase-like protein n=1 Tax=Roridomyces roridus TaxID=1738132 RepID=A0AAD7F7N9_9AGAR|nr:Metallo-dependent phosphatase-like protein [Roridomyces roridus]
MNPTRRVLILFALRGLVASAQSTTTTAGSLLSVFTVPGSFPTGAFTQGQSFYNDPTQTASQIQPVVVDPVETGVTYKLELTSPDSIPTNNTQDAHPLPPKASDDALLKQAMAQIIAISQNPVFGGNTCAQCQAGLEVAKFLALASPENGPALAIAMCTHFNFNSNCATMFSALSLGSVVTQVVANANVGGYDGQMLCNNFVGGLCPIPPATPLNLTSWFSKPKPNPLPAPKTPTGKRLNVLHISDFHLDPRYATSSEANCTSTPCCRSNKVNNASPNATLFHAPRYGAFKCDTPMALGLAALEAIPPMTGTQDTGFDFTLYTGDLVSHDPDNQLSRAYVEYTESLLFTLFKKNLGSGPVYTALGNHDSYNVQQDAQHAIGGELAEQFSWNYDHLAALWAHEEWLPEAAIDLARKFYSAFMVRRQDGLRIIALNTEMWYKANYFNYINLDQPDNSGMLRFLTDELQDAEDAGDRVWIIGHVLTGWDGTNPLVNPTDLFYQIVDRYSPHVIANIFFGHTHEDQNSIFYTNNATEMNAANALTTAWIGPGLTPLTNLNSGFRMYEVDSGTFEVMDAHTWRADVNAFPALDSQTAFGPTYVYEYSTRDTYGPHIAGGGWGANDPLNATFWHLVTEAMEADLSIVSTYNTLQGKTSVMTKPCTGACATAKICYIRSGSAAIARQNCQQGFGSVQS